MPQHGLRSSWFGPISNLIFSQSPPPPLPALAIMNIHCSLSNYAIYSMPPCSYSLYSVCLECISSCSPPVSNTYPAQVPYLPWGFSWSPFLPLPAPPPMTTRSRLGTACSEMQSFCMSHSLLDCPSWAGTFSSPGLHPMHVKKYLAHGGYPLSAKLIKNLYNLSKIFLTLFSTALQHEPFGLLAGSQIWVRIINSLSSYSHFFHNLYPSKSYFLLRNLSWPLFPLNFYGINLYISHNSYYNTRYVKGM